MSSIRVPLKGLNAARPAAPAVYVADRESQLTNLGNLNDGDILFLDGRVLSDPHALMESIGPGPDVLILFVYPEKGQTVAECVSLMSKEKFEAAIA